MKNVEKSFPSLVAFSDYLDNTVDVMEVDSLLDLMNLNKKSNGGDRKYNNASPRL